LIAKVDGGHSKSELVERGTLRQHNALGRFAMIVTVFRSRLMPGVREDYVALVDRMAELAATMPGYISHKGFFAEDGERCTIVEFESEEAQRAWRMNAEHREAQRKARDIYYAAYSVQICEVKREAKFDRNTQGQAAE
jgi:heme-degrading monooxygenase HmoA